ncbi:MAG: oligosaccharide repeat unit polymerase [Bacteroidetes bacterium]|nr:oligosaccharide repeat unit polymerase [Bacteroidota bacterium]
MEIFEKLISIFFSLAILLNGYLVGRWVKSFIFPASLFCFFWFAYTFFPLVFLFEVPVNAYSIAFIFFCTLFFSLSSLMFNWQIALTKNSQKLKSPKTLFKNSYLIKICYLLFFIILICLLIDLKIQGFAIFDFINNFYISSNQYLVNRYNDEIIINIYSQLANVLNYALTILGGIILGSGIQNTFKRNKLLLITLFPSTFITLTQSAKGTILLSVIFFFSGILISRIFKNNLELTNKKTNKAILIIFISLVFIMFFSFMTRGLYELDGSELYSSLKYNINSYTFGHIYAFSDWFSFHVFKNSQGYYVDKYYQNGFYTFMAIFKALGDTTIVPPGVFDEYFSYKNIFVTNIYTFFRGTISDFGILGSMFFFFCTGILTNFSFYTLLSSKKPLWTIPFFGIMLGYFYTSFIISLFIWKSIFGSIVVLVVILKINYIKNRNVL